MRQAFRDLLSFEQACGHEPSVKPPCFPDEKTIRLRMCLISEEYDELMTAIENRDLVEVADGAMDLVFVILGTCVRFGIDPVPLWRAVSDANLRKFGPGSWRDETGKVRKPADWVHPDIAAILAEQRPLAEVYATEEAVKT